MAASWSRVRSSAVAPAIAPAEATACSNRPAALASENAAPTVAAPAVKTAGIAGPFPADTVFVRAMRGEFDAVLAPYHDVGMTAIKVASFGEAVNVTLGLPFVRTSPDHGTAFDIAGQGKADASSMRQALEMAVELCDRAGRAGKAG